MGNLEIEIKKEGYHGFIVDVYERDTTIKKTLYYTNEDMMDILKALTPIAKEFSDEDTRPDEIEYLKKRIDDLEKMVSDLKRKSNRRLMQVERGF